MNAAHENRVGDVGDIALGIGRRNGRDGMRSHVDSSRRRDTLRVRSRTVLAAVLRPELIEMIDAASFVAVNDYEDGSSPKHGLSGARGCDRGACRCADRERAARARGFMRKAPYWRFLPCRQRRSSIPRVAAMPSAPGCCTGSPRAGTGSAPAVSRPRWARSRSHRAAARITPSAAIASQPPTTRLSVRTSGESIGVSGVTAANDAEATVPRQHREPATGGRRRRRSACARAHPMPMRVVRRAGLAHVVGGLATTVFVFPWVAMPCGRG